MSPPFTRVLDGLDLRNPFPGAKELERRRGRPYRARLGSNECLFGVCPAALDALREHGHSVALYADPAQVGLRDAIAARWGVPRSALVVGEGIEGLLALFVRAFIDPGDAAVTSLGGYPSFDYYVAGCGGRLLREPYTAEFTNDLSGLSRAVERSGAKVLYLANPDNPTGTLLSAASVRGLLDALPPSCLLLLDEAYAEFAPSDALLPSEFSRPNLVRLRTFSKVYGLAGMRVGFAVGPSELASKLDNIRQYFGVSSLAVHMATAALADDEHVARMVEACFAGREHYARVARELGLTVLPSFANFVTFDLGGPQRAKAVAAELDARDVFVRCPGPAPLDRFIRVTVAPQELRDHFVDALAAAVGKAEGVVG